MQKSDSGEDSEHLEALQPSEESESDVNEIENLLQGSDQVGKASKACSALASHCWTAGFILIMLGMVYICPTTMSGPVGINQMEGIPKCGGHVPRRTTENYLEQQSTAVKSSALDSHYHERQEQVLRDHGSRFYHEIQYLADSDRDNTWWDNCEDLEQDITDMIQRKDNYYRKIQEQVLRDHGSRVYHEVQDLVDGDGDITW